MDIVLVERQASMQKKLSNLKNDLDMDSHKGNSDFGNGSSKSILHEARDLHALSISQYEALQDQIMRLRDGHSIELRDLAERAKKEADYNLSLIQQLDDTLRDHDQIYSEEINKLCARLAAEVQAREDTLKEIGKQKSLTFAAEENYLREKDACEQALNHLSAVIAEYNSLKSEAESLSNELSKLKKVHAFELEKLEKALAHQKQLLDRADTSMMEIANEKAQLLEKLRLTEDKERLLLKRIELERLQYDENNKIELEKHGEEMEQLEKEIKGLRLAAEKSQARLQEMEEEKKRKNQDSERRLHEAERSICHHVQRQFLQIRGATNL